MTEESKIEEKKYEEIGSNYRFFLGWRHAALAGYLVVLFGVISITITAYKEDIPIAPWIPLICAPVGVIIWLIDNRTIDLYHAAIRAGKNLEGEKGGFYTELSEHVVKCPDSNQKKGKLTHSRTLKLIFLGYSIGSGILTVVLLFCKPT